MTPSPIAFGDDNPGRQVGSALEVDVIIKTPLWTDAITQVQDVCRKAAVTAVKAASTRTGNWEVCIVLADDSFVQALNRDYRSMDKPTNVLSFPAFDEADGDFARGGEDRLPLGDVVIAFETVEKEAVRDNKTLEAHLSHMVVHGVLHVLGLDHEDESDAAKMEALEVRALGALGFPDPYGETT